MPPAAATHITIFGMVIGDPLTALTNFFILGISLLAWRQLLRKSITASFSKTWRFFFLLIGISAFVSVAVHCLTNYIPANIIFILWLAMGWTQGLGVTFAQLATIEKHFSHRGNLLQGIVFLQLAIFSFVLFFFKNYAAVKFQLLVGLLPVMFIEIRNGLRGNKAAMWIGWGIFVSSFSGIAHTFRLSISPFVQYNDIAHFFIIISLVMMRKGIVDAGTNHGLSSNARSTVA